MLYQFFILPGFFILSELWFCYYFSYTIINKMIYFILSGFSVCKICSIRSFFELNFYR